MNYNVRPALRGAVPSAVGEWVARDDEPRRRMHLERRGTVHADLLESIAGDAHVRGATAMRRLGGEEAAAMHEAGKGKCLNRWVFLRYIA